MSEEKTSLSEPNERAARLLKTLAEDKDLDPEDLAEVLLDGSIRKLLGPTRALEIDRLRQDADEAGLTFPEYIRQLSKLGRELGAADAIREQHGIAKKDD